MSSAPLIRQSEPSEPAPGPALRVVRPTPAADPAAGWPLVVLMAFPALVTAWGLPYYAAGLAQRLRHPLHPLLRPSGSIGLTFGVVALVLFLFMWLYPFRKSARWLTWTGSVGRWLDVHIVIGLALPLIAAVHAGWHFDGIIGMGLVAMIVVSLSGIVGRYLYTHLPRSRTGLELSLEEAGAERRALLTNLSIATGLTPQELERDLALDPRPYDDLSLFATFGRLLADDWKRAATLRHLEHTWSQAGAHPLRGPELRDALRLARLEMTLSHQMRAVDATRKVFAWWHIAHRPFALTALLSVLVHVVVALWVGGVHIGSFGSH